MGPETRFPPPLPYKKIGPFDFTCPIIDNFGTSHFQIRIWFFLSFWTNWKLGEIQSTLWPTLLGDTLYQEIQAFIIARVNVF